MAKEVKIFGIIITIIGIALLFIQNPISIVYGILFILIGIALTIFSKEESKLEQRKDIKTKQSKG